MKPLMTVDELKNCIRTVPDFPKKGIQFKDITPLLKNPDAFGTVLEIWKNRYSGAALKAVAGVEARGFVLAAALAARLNVGFIPLRKPGKLPAAVHRETYALEYGEDAVEMHQDAVSPGERVLLVDDVLATGGTAAAAVRLLENAGAVVHEAAFLMRLSFLHGEEKLPKTPLHFIMEF